MAFLATRPLSMFHCTALILMNVSRFGDKESGLVYDPTPSETSIQWWGSTNRNGTNPASTERCRDRNDRTRSVIGVNY